MKTLKEGEVICNQCKGKGCIKCDGIGIVDWITNAMGVPKRIKGINNNVMLGVNAGFTTTGYHNIAIGYKTTKKEI